MPLGKWSLPGELSSVTDRISRVFEDAFSDVGKQGKGGARWDFKPPVDIYEAESAVHMMVELPGVKLEEIILEVTDEVLVLKGERKFEPEVNENACCRKERCFGLFYRAFSLRPDIDEKKISASLKNGILLITIPKKEPERPRKISVNVE